MKKIITILCLILITVPLSTRAFSFEEFFDELEKKISGESGNSSQIINKVEVHTNTGGNTATDGEVIEGEGKAKIEVKNIINGEEIEPIEIETEANEVKVRSEVKVEDGEVSVKKEIEINSEINEENYQADSENENAGDVSFDNRENEKDKIGGNLGRIHNWWQNFLDNLFASLINIFSIFSK